MSFLNVGASYAELSNIENAVWRRATISSGDFSKKPYALHDIGLVRTYMRLPDGRAAIVKSKQNADWR